jgi:hypothetical protein
MPFIAISKNMEVINPPIPLEFRAPAGDVYRLLEKAAFETPNVPITGQSTISSGTYTFGMQPAAGEDGKYVIVPLLLINIGPNMLSTTIGSLFTLNVTGFHANHMPLAISGLQLRLRRTNEGGKILILPYQLINTKPVLSPARAQLNYIDQFGTYTCAGASPATVTNLAKTVPITISGTGVDGINVDATIVTPSHPLFAGLRSKLMARA